jgi:hypothetical protein
MDRITPDNIQELAPNEIFVFGSNNAGIHGAGAALLAKKKFNAKQGIGIGPTGRCYAIPTKSHEIDFITGKSHLETFPIAVIAKYVLEFITYANNPEYQNYKFLVTKIGCGLAGYSVDMIAPLFRPAVNMKNIYLPKEFWEVLNRYEKHTY